MFKNLPGLGVAGFESGPSTWVDGAGKGTHAESVISGSSEGKSWDPDVVGRFRAGKAHVGRL